MLERRKPLDLLFPLKGGASKDVGVKEGMTAAQRLRAAVNLTADAVKAVSLTAMEALREGAAFIGIVGEQDELIDPFHHLDAPIWAFILSARFCANGIFSSLPKPRPIDTIKSDVVKSTPPADS